MEVRSAPRLDEDALSQASREKKRRAWDRLHGVLDIAASAPQEKDLICPALGRRSDLGKEGLSVMPITHKACRLHDAGDWMDWSGPDAVVYDGMDYIAELADGQAKLVTAEVHGEEEVDLRFVRLFTLRPESLA